MERDGLEELLLVFLLVGFLLGAAFRLLRPRLSKRFTGVLVTTALAVALIVGVATGWGEASNMAIGVGAALASLVGGALLGVMIAYYLGIT